MENNSPYNRYQLKNVEFGKVELSEGCLGFVRNSVHVNKLCYPSKFNIRSQWHNKNFHIRLLQLNMGPTLKPILNQNQLRGSK